MTFQPFGNQCSSTCPQEDGVQCLRSRLGVRRDLLDGWTVEMCCHGVVLDREWHRFHRRYAEQLISSSDGDFHISHDHSCRVGCGSATCNDVGLEYRVSPLGDAFIVGVRREATEEMDDILFVSVGESLLRQLNPLGRMPGGNLSEGSPLLDTRNTWVFLATSHRIEDNAGNLKRPGVLSRGGQSIHREHGSVDT